MKIKLTLPKSKSKRNLPKRKSNEEKSLQNIIPGCFTQSQFNQGLIHAES